MFADGTVVMLQFNPGRKENETTLMKINKDMRATAFSIFLLCVFSVCHSQQRPVLNIMLTNYEYPYEVSFLDLKSQNQDLKMAYMDVHRKNRMEKP